VALAVTAGIVLDRYLELPFALGLLLAGGGVVAWFLTSHQGRHQFALAYLAVAAVGVGAAYHHWQRDVYAADDIGNYAGPERQLARIQGTLEEEPVIFWQPAQKELRTMPKTSDPTVAVLRARRMRSGDEWIDVSGRIQLVVSVHWQGQHVGDEIEAIGYLQQPRPPANPGEADHAGQLRDQHIRARLLVSKTPEALHLREERWPRTFNGWLAVIRGWGQHTLAQAVPRRGGLAMALLLGDGSTMTSEDWEKYIRTGVIHVLAISGQHLVVLALFLWGIVRVAGVRRRSAALGIAGFLLFYSLLAGGRPPVMRSAVSVCVIAGGLMLRRPVVAANSFALAWLTVAALNPTDLFTPGCQLSFCSVAVLYWGASRWFRKSADSLERLIDQTRPWWMRTLRHFGRELAITYGIGLAIWLALTPLVASRYHLVTLQGLLIGPPLVLLTSIALISGFLLLGCAAVLPPLVPLFALPVDWSLAGCEALVNVFDQLRLGRWYVPDIPEWWLWVFYPGLFAVLTSDALHRRWRWAILAAFAWLGIGLLAGAMRPASGELRCTFLAVGHGGCTVLETPDGRTLLYDAGSMTGPDVTRKQIAPYLWSRGIRRIDEVFLSHADLDHFNGLSALLERFSVGQVTCTPTFEDKQTSGVAYTLQALERHGVPIRIVSAGDVLSAGDVVMEVLHPPRWRLEGNENTRSLVLLIRHAGHSILLTGDLEGAGLERVLTNPAPAIDVLMAPHHGSRVANTPALARWASAKYIVSSQGLPRGDPRWKNPYAAHGGIFLPTYMEGAVTIRSKRDELSLETFLTRQRLVLPAGRGP
jgi:competence protein ComEC